MSVTDNVASIHRVNVHLEGPQMSRPALRVEVRSMRSKVTAS